MRITTTLAASAAIAVAGVAANAGGLGDAGMSDDDMAIEVPMAASMGEGSTGSLGGGAIIMGLLVALLAASSF